MSTSMVAPKLDRSGDVDNRLGPDNAPGQVGWKPTKEMVEEVFSEDQILQLKATIAFRKAVAKEQDLSISGVVQAGVIPRFVAFLSSKNPKLQYEAAWAITNITYNSGDHVHVVIEAGAIPELITLMDSPVLEVRKEAAWALGNIAGESPICRDRVLESGALPPLVKLLSEDRNLSLLRIGVWTLSNFCQSKHPSPDWELVYPALSVLPSLVCSLDVDVVTNACWAISYLADGCTDNIQAVIESGVCRQLVHLLTHHSSVVQTPALRSIASIAVGDDQQSQTVVTHGGLPAFLTLLTSPKPAIQKKACWALSNIVVGSPRRVQAMIDNGIVPLLIDILRNGDLPTKKEACWVISNATYGGVQEACQVRYLVSQGCIGSLCDMLGTNGKVAEVALHALCNILEVGEVDKGWGNAPSRNPYAAMIEEAGALPTIHLLQYGGYSDVRHRASMMLRKYFFSGADTGDNI